MQNRITANPYAPLQKEAIVYISSRQTIVYLFAPYPVNNAWSKQKQNGRRKLAFR